MNTVCWSEGLYPQTYQFALSYELQKRRKSFFYDTALLYNLLKPTSALKTQKNTPVW